MKYPVPVALFPGPVISPAVPVPKSNMRDQFCPPLTVTHPSIVQFVSEEISPFGKSTYPAVPDPPPGSDTAFAFRVHPVPSTVPCDVPTESSTAVPLPSLKLYRCVIA